MATKHVQSPVLPLAILVVGCAPESAQPTLSGWLGDSEHLRVVGSVEGEDIDIDDGSVIDVACLREYVAPLVNGMPDESQARFVELKLFAQIDDGGEARYLTIEFKQHDLQSDAIASVIEIVPRLETAPPGPTQMWVEWEWNDDWDGLTLLETAAQAGSFTLALFSGEPGPSGVVIPPGEGQIGGYLDARWTQTDTLQVSFTASCRDNLISAEG